MVHRQVETPEELGHYLGRFGELSSYQVGHLALHGGRGRVNIGKKAVTTEDLIAWSRLGAPRRPSADRGEELVVDLTGKVLYLGSCATLGISRERLQRLRAESGAVAVCGYTKSVDWYEAGGFDVILLAALAEAMDNEPRTAQRAIKRLWKRSGTLSETLGFVCEPDWRP